METANQYMLAQVQAIQEKQLAKREAYAMRAMASLIEAGHGFAPTKDIANTAVEYADALIEALKKDKK